MIESLVILVIFALLGLLLGITFLRLGSKLQETESQVRELRDRLKEIERVVLDRH